jgi:hypothetical protein
MSGWQGPIREMQTAMVLRMIPHPMDVSIRSLTLALAMERLPGLC